MTLTYHQIMQLEAAADDLTAVAGYMASLANSHRLKSSGVNLTTLPDYVKRLERTAVELLAMREEGVEGVQVGLFENQ